MVMEVNENKDELNKDDLNKAREKIGAVDKKMAELFCERMNAVRMVADYKMGFLYLMHREKRIYLPEI